MAIQATPYQYGYGCFSPFIVLTVDRTNGIVLYACTNASNATVTKR